MHTWQSPWAGKLMWIALMRAVGGVTAVPVPQVQGNQQRATVKASHGISSDRARNLSMGEIFIEAQTSRRLQQVLTRLIHAFPHIQHLQN